MDQCQPFETMAGMSTALCTNLAFLQRLKSIFLGNVAERRLGCVAIADTPTFCPSGSSHFLPNLSFAVFEARLHSQGSTSALQQSRSMRRIAAASTRRAVWACAASLNRPPVALRVLVSAQMCYRRLRKSHLTKNTAVYRADGSFVLRLRRIERTAL